MVVLMLAVAAALVIDPDHAIETQQALTGQARTDSISCYV